MPFAGLGAGFIAALRSGGSAAVNAAKSAARTANNPKDFATKLAELEVGALSGNFKHALGWEIWREGFPGIIDYFKEKLRLKKPKALRDLLDIEEVIQIQCTDKKTGRVNTHTFLVNRRDLQHALTNPQELVRDAGLEGCSGEEGKDTGINVTIL